MVKQVFKMRRSSRLKARKPCNDNSSQIESHEEGNGTEKSNLEALVQQTYQFMMAKMAAREPTSSATSNATEVPEFLSITSELAKLAKDPTELASELQPGLDNTDLYLRFDCVGTNSARQTSGGMHQVETQDDKEVMRKCVITPDFERRETAPPMHVSHNAKRKQKKEAREETAGPKWYNLPATKLTPELKQDLKLMKMRNVLDRKRHYKSNDNAALPKYFQVGTIVEGATDFYSSRVPKRDRKQTLVDQLLADAEFRRYNKKKYLEIQTSKQSGKKGFYKKKLNKSKSGWKRR